MLKWILIAAGAVVVLVGAALAFLPRLLDTPAMQTYVSQAAAHALGRPVKVASLSVSVLPLPTVRLRGLQVAEDPAFGPGSFLTVGEGRLGIRLRPLLSGRIELADLTLEEPRIELVEDQAGRWNLATLGASTSPARTRSGGGRAGSGPAGAVLLSRVRIVNGDVQYRKLGATALAARLEKINLTVTQDAMGDVLRVRGDAVGQPGGVRLVIRDATLGPAEARSFADMPLKASVDVEASDVAPLSGAAVMSPRLSGPVKGRLEVTGTATRFSATGAMSFDRLTLSENQPRCGEPRLRRLALDEVRMPLAFSPTRLDSLPLQAKVARGSVSARLSLTLQPAPVASLKEIAVKGVELQPILVDYLCEPYAVTGPLDLTGEASARVADVWRSASGSGQLRIGPGKVLGKDIVSVVDQVTGLAGAVSSVIDPERRPRAGSPLEFDSITATYTVTSGVLRTDDLLYQTRDVRVAAAGTYGLQDGRVALDVTLTQGRNQFKGTVSGTSGALRVVPTGVKLEDTRGLKKLLDKLLR